MIMITVIICDGLLP